MLSQNILLQSGNVAFASSIVEASVKNLLNKEAFSALFVKISAPLLRGGIVSCLSLHLYTCFKIFHQLLQLCSPLLQIASYFNFS